VRRHATAFDDRSAPHEPGRGREPQHEARTDREIAAAQDLAARPSANQRGEVVFRSERRSHFAGAQSVFVGEHHYAPVERSIAQTLCGQPDRPVSVQNEESHRHAHDIEPAVGQALDCGQRLARSSQIAAFSRETVTNWNPARHRRGECTSTQGGRPIQRARLCTGRASHRCDRRERHPSHRSQDRGRPVWRVVRVVPRRRPVVPGCAQLRTSGACVQRGSQHQRHDAVQLREGLGVSAVRLGRLALARRRHEHLYVPRMDGAARGVPSALASRFIRPTGRYSVYKGSDPSS
jgi:hypothetical protein